MADEVWLDVLPSMKGFGADLARKATSAARGAGSKAGQEYSKSFDKGAGNAAQKAVADLEVAQKKAAGLVSKLSGQVSQARQSQARSAADLLMAEQRLADATERHGEDSNQAQAAALRLEAARDKAAGATQKFENAENGLREAQNASKAVAGQLADAQAALSGEVKKAPGLWGKLKRAIGDTEGASARTRKTWDGLKTGAKTLGKGIGIAAAAVGALGLTVAGMAIKGGIDRALNIEDARASMTGLGHDTKTVDGIMANALASVKGTSFGLGDAATIASTAVAAGIKPGEKLENILKLTANTASIARVGLDEMGSVLNKVWTSGRVSTEELNQIADKGIPIWTKLAEHYGTNADELRKMVSKGKVDADTFATVLTGTVGNAADAMGQTTRGMWANLKSAMSRGGEVIAGPFLKVFKDGMAEAIPMIDNVVNAMKPFMEQVADKLPGVLDLVGTALSTVWDVVANKIVPALVASAEWFKRNHEWLMPITVALVSGAVAWKIYDLAVGGTALAMGTFQKLVPKVKAGILAVTAALRANPIGIVITILGALVGAFIYLWNTNEGFRNFFINSWNAIKDTVANVWGAISPTFDAIVSAVRDGLGAAFTWLNEKIIQPVAQAISWAVGGTGDAVTGVWGATADFVKTVFGGAFTWLNDTIIQPVGKAISSAIGAVGNVIGTVFGAVGSFVKTVFGPVFSWLYDKIIKPYMGLVKWYVELVSNILLFAFDLVVFGLKKLGEGFVWLYQNAVKPAWEGIKNFTATIWNGIKSFLAGTWTVIKGIFTAIVNFVRGPLASGFRWIYDYIIKPVWSGIKWYINTTWTGMKAIFNAIVNFVRGPLASGFTWFYNNLVKPVWDGIKWFINTAWTGIKATFNTIVNFVRGPLASGFKWLYDKGIKPIWDAISSTIKNTWNNQIKPIFQTLGDFIKKHVVPAFKTGVEAIGKAWEGIKKAAGTPVYFVLETVYNKGIKAAFDKVSEGIGSKARLPRANTDNIPHFAKGGLHKGGWALVGEEGPELINTGPGHVYTANQTQQLLNGKKQAPMGALDALSDDGSHQSEMSIGGFAGNAWDGIKGAAKAVTSSLGSVVKKGISWVRGGLAAAADFLLKPARNFLTGSIDGSNPFGGIVQKVGTNALDGVVKWIRGEDDKAVADDGGPEFIGARGGFARPSKGPITSGFGASRGRYPHAGIDIAGGGPTYAAWGGKVQKVGWNIVPGRTGIGILMDHGKGLQTYSGHNPVGGVRVQPGQQVTAGQRIGAQGATGNVTGTHLHWETWNNGKPVNPRRYMKYDNGGVLAPGRTSVVNDTGKPEAIYTAPQNQALQTLAARGAEAGSGNDIKVTIVAPEEATAGEYFRLFKHEVAVMNRRGGNR